MNSKAFLLLGLLFAMVLLISSEVSARDLSENTDKETKENNEEFDAKYSGDQYGGGGGRWGGGGGGGSWGGGGGGCRYGGCGGGGGGYGCRYGCCGRGGGYYGGGGCRRCCSYVGEAVDAEPQN